MLHDDESRLKSLGYSQELSRCLNGFSNFAISLSIICILAGGLTSFHLGYAAAGTGGVMIGWAVCCLFSLAVAATMGQLASAMPTAGGLYHWAAILGGRGWGWATSWFNFAGLIAVLAAINVGMIAFAYGVFSPEVKPDALTQLLILSLVTASQAIINHCGIRITRMLTDFSGYWIMLVSVILTISLFCSASLWDWQRFITFQNFSGLPTGDQPVWPRIENLWWVFALGLLLPAYTITGFDASAHTSEETVSAGTNVPNGIVRSVAISGIFGLLMVGSIVLAIPNVEEGAEQGANIVMYTIRAVLPKTWADFLLGACVFAQYLCGLATLTSASRMAFAFARDGGLPASYWLKKVSLKFQTPAAAIWVVSIVMVLFTVYTPVYSTITAVCTIFLYISYVLPTVFDLLAYQRTWLLMGPWQLGGWYRPLAVISIIGSVGLIIIGVQPPNEQTVIVVGGFAVALVFGWFAFARKRFPGPPAMNIR